MVGLVTLALIAVSVFVFFLLALQGSDGPQNYENFNLAGRRAVARQFGSSLAAASTSFATVIVFFIGTYQLYGPVLLWCGLTYLAGQVLLIKLFRRVNLETKDLTTNADFIVDRLSALVSARVVAFLTALAFLLILFLEMYIGARLAAYYFPDWGAWWHAVAFAGVAAVAIGYVGIGGLGVVFRTDVWQFYMMLAACASFLVFALLVDTSAVAERPPLIGAAPIEVFLFCVWILVLNLTLPFTQLSSWQRLAGTRSVDEAWKGLIKTAPGFFAIWWLPVIALVILGAKGYSAADLESLFTLIRSSDPVLVLVTFPVIFVGFASALFSTADTALVALTFALTDKVTFGDSVKKLKGAAYRKSIVSAMMLVAIGLTLLFTIAKSDLSDAFIALVYTLFGTLTIVAPPVLYAILTWQRAPEAVALSGVGDVVLAFSMVLAALILVAGTMLVLSGTLPRLGVQEIATLAALLVSGSGMALAVKLRAVKLRVGG